MTIDLSGKQALITGGSSGIGFETAKGLLTLGAAVTITGRNQSKLELARDFLVKDTGKSAVTIVQADFAFLDQVDMVAQAAKGCDILVNNAGLIETKRVLTGDGFERQWQVNVLAPTLLMARLTETMPPQGRIVNVASGVHRRASLELSDVNFESRPYGAMAAYGQSKLALIMLTRAISSRLGENGPLINAVHPGLVRTDFARDAGWFGLLFGAFKPLYLSARRGARTVLHAACSPFVNGVSGAYFEKSAPVEPSQAARDAAKADELFEVVRQQLELPPQIWPQA